MQPAMPGHSRLDNDLGRFLAAALAPARGPMAVVVSGANIDRAEHARLVAGAGRARATHALE